MRNLIGAVRFLAAFVISMVMATVVIITLPFNRQGRLFHALSRTWAHLVLTACSIRVSVAGCEKLDQSHSYVYVSNHASAFDIPAILAGVPDQIRIVYKKELERIPIFGWGLRWGSYIGIDRRGGTDALRSLEEAAAEIRQGASVLLYAEGTRTLDGKLQPFKRGAFSLAVRAGVPVVPLTVNGSFHILPKHSICVRPGNIRITLGSPIGIGEVGGRESERQLMQRVHDAIAREYVEQ